MSKAIALRQAARNQKRRIDTAQARAREMQEQMAKAQEQLYTAMLGSFQSATIVDSYNEHRSGGVLGSVLDWIF